VNELLHTFLTWTKQVRLSCSAHGGFSLRIRDCRTHRTGGWVWTHTRAGRDGEEQNSVPMPGTA